MVATTPALDAAVAALRNGHGPVAVDAERASGYRYSQRAYLIQLRRAGTGTVLLDPTAFADLDRLGATLNPCEWVLHSAAQDLPCLAELGLGPQALFDTELAARLAGLDRVGLAPLAEDLLGYRLQKGYGAADWSTRPLPAEWLTYAALDVELLVPMADTLSDVLDRQGKSDWAREEFEAVRTAPQTPARPEPWRRTSGIHRVRTRYQLALVRELWQAREHVARQRDLAPTRVLPDSAIIRAALADPHDEAALTALPVFGGRIQRKRAQTWWAALHRARSLPASARPANRPQTDGPPPPNRWHERDPEATARLAASRAALNGIAEHHRLPVANLLAPELVRRLCWQPPQHADPAGVDRALRAGGARGWQRQLTRDALSEALVSPQAA